MDRRYSNTSTAVGVLLILLGLVFFAVTQGVFDIQWRTAWPLFPTVGGLFLLALAIAAPDLRRRSSLVFAGMVPLLVGLFFFSATTGILPREDMGRLWPIFPLSVGIAFFAAYFASGGQQRFYLIPGSIVTTVALVFGAILWSGGSYGVIGQLWPVFLIVAGVALLLPRLRRRER